MTESGQQSEEVKAAATFAERQRAEIDTRTRAVAAAHSAFQQQGRTTIAAIAALDEVAAVAQPAADAGLLAARLHAVREDAARLGSAAGTLAAAAQPGDPRHEWEECRKTIDRFDKLLVDLRKTGFGVIATIFSAAAFLFAYAPTAATVPLPPRVKVAIFIVICLLIVSTYSVDRVHQIWLEVAVGRAKCLEQMLGFRITQEISQRFSATHAGLIWSSLYGLLLFMGWLIFAMSLRLKWTDGHQTLMFLAFITAVASIVGATFFGKIVRLLRAKSAVGMILTGLISLHLTGHLVG